MLIAQQKRHENIAEYLLYMWQVEDLLRACELDDERIDQLLVARFASAHPTWCPSASGISNCET